MEKKTNSVLSKFGFQDSDLTTPKHDEICLWVNNNIKKIISELRIFNKEELKSGVELRCSGCERYTYSENTGCFNWNNFSCEKHKEENPALKKSFERAYNFFNEEIKEELKSEVVIGWEYPIKAPNNFLVGYVDFRIIISPLLFEIERIQLRHNFKLTELWIEVKPEVKSIGETIRQINTYKSYSSVEIFILVTKTKGLKDLFKQQGILVYEIE